MLSAHSLPPEGPAWSPQHQAVVLGVCDCSAVRGLPWGPRPSAWFRFPSRRAASCHPHPPARCLRVLHSWAGSPPTVLPWATCAAGTEPGCGSSPLGFVTWQPWALRPVTAFLRLPPRASGVSGRRGTPGSLWPELTLCGRWLPWHCPCLSHHFWWRRWEKLAVTPGPHVRDLREALGDQAAGEPLLSRGRACVCRERPRRKPGLGPPHSQMLPGSRLLKEEDPAAGRALYLLPPGLRARPGSRGACPGSSQCLAVE